MTLNGEETTRTPSMSFSQAFGYSGTEYFEYVIIGSNHGESNESGETLFQYRVRYDKKHLICNELIPISSTEINLYVNKKGEAYKSWKGKLESNPVCNFYTGRVFKYKG